MSKEHLHFIELGKYLDRLAPDTKVTLISEDYTVTASVYCFRSDFRSLMRLEVGYSDFFPFTLYL